MEYFLIEFFGNKFHTLTQPDWIYHLFCWLQCCFSIKLRNFDHAYIFLWMKFLRWSKRMYVYQKTTNVNAQILKTCRVPQDRWKTLRSCRVQRIDLCLERRSVFPKNDEAFWNIFSDFLILAKGISDVGMDEYSLSNHVRVVIQLNAAAESEEISRLQL